MWWREELFAAAGIQAGLEQDHRVIIYPRDAIADGIRIAAATRSRE